MAKNDGGGGPCFTHLAEERKRIRRRCGEPVRPQSADVSTSLGAFGSGLHGLQFNELGESVRAKLTAVAGLLVAAKRGCDVERTAVD